MIWKLNPLNFIPFMCYLDELGIRAFGPNFRGFSNPTPLDHSRGVGDLARGVQSTPARAHLDRVYHFDLKNDDAIVIAVVANAVSVSFSVHFYSIWSKSRTFSTLGSVYGPRARAYRVIKNMYSQRF